MFEFLTNKSTPAATTTSAKVASPLNVKPAAEPHPLDALTGGAFSAPTAGDRAAKIRERIQKSPSVEQMQEVFKELGARDKGAV